ncbi:MAG: winged helix-turn-helix domain-containing protein [Bacteroidota bacterium]
MNVKNGFTFDKALKISLVFGVAVVLLTLVSSLSQPGEQFNKQQAHIAVRAIGDELLSNAHDHSSPVQPLQQIDEHTLRLSFQKSIPINPDSLSWLALKFIHSEIATKAIVSVLEVASSKLVYGFEINRQTPKEIPCLGRNLPTADYYVDVSLYQQEASLLGFNIFTFALLGCILVSLALLVIPLSKGKTAKVNDHASLQVKGMKLDLRTNQILTQDQIIKLTDKEAQIFSILFQHEGQLVSREYLTEEVWLKEGVVTSRSLDMYISRLRKKIKGISNTEILNQRGKGYSLKVQ